MSRTIIVNSEVHLTDKRRSRVESRIQEKFPDDRILILPPELRIQQIVPKE